VCPRKGTTDLSDIASKRSRAHAGGGRKYTQRRQAIIAAAAEVFASKGLTRTSMLDISDRSGVDRASIYYYFKNKHDLFLAVIRDKAQSALGEVTEIVLKDAPERDRLIDVLTRVTRAFAEDYPVWHAYFEAHMDEPRQDSDGAEFSNPEAEETEALVVTYRATLAQLVADGVASGQFRDVGDPHLIAHIIEGAVGRATRWFDPLDGPSIDEVSHAVVEILIRGLSVPVAR
jgi:AcrR family transcriptional regulator